MKKSLFSDLELEEIIRTHQQNHQKQNNPDTSNNMPNLQNNEAINRDNEISPPVLKEKQTDLKNKILKELKQNIPINKRQQLTHNVI